MNYSEPRNRFSWLIIICAFFFAGLVFFARICKLSQRISKKYNISFEKVKNAVTNILLALSIIIAYLTMVLLKGLLGIDLFTGGQENANWGTPLYSFIWYVIPVLLSISFFIFFHGFNKGFPKNGTWYCSGLQIQLCFDKTEDTFIVINQEQIPCELKIRSDSNYCYLFSQNSIDGCLFSGRLVSVRKNTMRIEERNNIHTVHVFHKIY